LRVELHEVDKFSRFGLRRGRKWRGEEKKGSRRAGIGGGSGIVFKRVGERSELSLHNNLTSYSILITYVVL
jgi:hypothetical protein